MAGCAGARTPARDRVYGRLTLKARSRSNVQPRIVQDRRWPNWATSLTQRHRWAAQQSSPRAPHTRTSSVAPQRSRHCGFLTELLVGEHRRGREEGDGEHARPYVFADMPRREAHQVYAGAGTRWLHVGRVTRPPSVVSYGARTGVVFNGDVPVKASSRYRCAPAYRSLQDAELERCFLPSRRTIERKGLGCQYPQLELSS